MGLFDTLGRIFGRRKPLPPQVGKGNRGIAMGSRKKPALQSYEERLKRGHEEISEDEVRDFIYDSQLMHVNSSNVVAVQFFLSENKMMVQFKDGAYLYWPISEQEAISFARAQSKGSWIWSVCRVRGSKTAHRKNYVKL